MDTKQITVGYVGKYVKYIPDEGEEGDVILDKYGDVYVHEISEWARLTVPKVFYFYNETKDELLKVNKCKRDMRPTNLVGKTGLFLDAFTKLLYKKCKGHYHKIAKTGHLPAVTHYTYVEEYGVIQYKHLGDAMILSPNSQITEDKIKDIGNGVCEIDLTGGEVSVLTYDAIDLSDHTKSIRVNEIFGVLTQKQNEQAAMTLYTDGMVKKSYSGRGKSVKVEKPPTPVPGFLLVGIPVSLAGPAHVDVIINVLSAGRFIIYLRRAIRIGGKIVEHDVLLEKPLNIDTPGVYEIHQDLEKEINPSDMLMIETEHVNQSTQEQLDHRVEATVHPFYPATLPLNSGTTPVYDHLFGYNKSVLKSDENLKEQILQVGIGGGLPAYKLNRLNFTFTDMRYIENGDKIPNGSPVDARIVIYATNKDPGSPSLPVAEFNTTLIPTGGAISEFRLIAASIPRGYMIAGYANLKTVATPIGLSGVLTFRAAYSLSGQRY